jgi:hypothetical protein
MAKMCTPSFTVKQYPTIRLRNSRFHVIEQITDQLYTHRFSLTASPSDMSHDVKLNFCTHTSPSTPYQTHYNHPH